MTNILTRWIDGKIAGLGYAKAEEKRPRSITSLFSGEAPQYETVTRWDDWSDEQIERLAVTSGWIYSDINITASTLAPLEFSVFEKLGEGLQEVVLHDFEVLFEWPNEFMDQAWLMEYSVWWYQLRGESYWWLVPDRSGQLAEIWPIPASRMQPVPDPKTYIKGYAYKMKQGSESILIPKEQVCFVRRPNPFDYHRGMSPISAYRMTLESDTSAAKWNRDTFENELVLRMMINLPQDTSDPVYHSLKQELIDELQKKGRRWWIGRAGDVDIKELGMKPKDIEFLALREFARKEMDRVYGIPEGFWSEQATRCYSEDTQALTLDGWKHYWELSPEDKIACYNRESGAMVFERPSDIIINEACEREMVHLSSAAVDILVTPNHRMLYKTRYWKEALASDIAKLNRVRFHAAPEEYEGKEVPTFMVPAAKQHKYGPKIRAVGVSMDDWLAFLGYIISEAGISSKPCPDGRQRYYIGMGQKQGPMAQKMDALFERVPWHISGYDAEDDMRRWSLSDKSLWKWCVENAGCGAANKRIPKEILSMGLNRRQLRVLWEALIDGDGTRDTRPNRASGAYYTTSEKLVDDIQMLAVMLGIRSQVCGPYCTHLPSGRVSKLWVVRWAEQNFAETYSMEYVPYYGTTWCVTVPAGWFVTRRNNKITIQGNSNAEAARTTFIEQAVWPIATKFHHAISGQILRRYYGEQFRGRFADARPRDRRLLVLERRQYWMVKTIGEARKDLGMKPLGDGRDGMLVPEITGQRGIPITTVQTISPYNQGEGRDEKALLLLPPSVQGLVLKEAQEDLRRWKSIELRRLEEGQDVGTYEFETESIPLEVQNYVSLYLEEATTEDDIREVFEDAKSQLGETSAPELPAFSSAKGAVLPGGETAKQVDWNELTPEGRLAVEKRLSRKLKAVLATWLAMMAKAIVSGEEAPLDEVEFGQQIAAPVTVVLVEYATAKAQQAMAELGPEVDPAQIAAAALEWAHGYGATLAQQLAQTSAKAVNAAVEQFRLNPTLTEAQISDMIEPAFSQARADKVSVSEVTRALATGVLLARTFLERLGVQVVLRYYTAADERVCPQCAPLHGTTEDVWGTEYPEGPPIHSNCRCQLVAEPVE